MKRLKCKFCNQGLKWAPKHTWQRKIKNRFCSEACIILHSDTQKKEIDGENSK